MMRKRYARRLNTVSHTLEKHTKRSRKLTYLTPPIRFTGPIGKWYNGSTDDKADTIHLSRVGAGSAVTLVGLFVWYAHAYVILV